MRELMGSLRPIKQRINTTGPTHHYDVEPIGAVTTSVRYQEVNDLGIIEVLDEARLPWAAGAEGFALFDQSGELLTVIGVVTAKRGEDFILPPGWGFKASLVAGGTAKAETAETVRA